MEGKKEDGQTAKENPKTPDASVFDTETIFVLKIESAVLRLSSEGGEVIIDEAKALDQCMHRWRRAKNETGQEPSAAYMVDIVNFVVLDLLRAERRRMRAAQKVARLREVEALRLEEERRIEDERRLLCDCLRKEHPKEMEVFETLTKKRPKTQAERNRLVIVRKKIRLACAICAAALGVDLESFFG